MTSGACIRIMNGERSISAQMAIRFGQAFGTTAHYWLNLQATRDLKQARADAGRGASHRVLRGGLTAGSGSRCVTG